ncbi:MAG: 2-oxoglutarate dehydrogenase E1 component, partial [Allosphingosinicella sp.]
MDNFGDREPGPSWARDNWPLIELDDLNAGLEPTLLMPAAPGPAGAGPAPVERVAAGAKEAAAAAGSSAAEIERAAQDSIRAMMLIRTYRVRGHLAADLDPLGLHQRPVPADLTPEFHGFSGEDLDRPIFLDGTLGFEWASVREIVEVLRRNYCGKVGLEYMHINDLEERRFLQDRMEGIEAEIRFTPEGKQAILAKVIQGEQWEKFLARKYVGTKR